jgi:hypothetical protein
MFDTITQAGRWVVFEVSPFLAGVGLLLLPVWLIWKLIYWRRVAGWRRWMERAVPHVRSLAESWSIDGPPELTFALCHAVWLPLARSPLSPCLLSHGEVLLPRDRRSRSVLGIARSNSRRRGSQGANVQEELSVEARAARLWTKPSTPSRNVWTD